jgi:hypothetical protein
LRRRKEGKNARRDVVASPINFPWFHSLVSGWLRSLKCWECISPDNLLPSQQGVSLPGAAKNDSMQYRIQSCLVHVHKYYGLSLVLGELSTFSLVVLLIVILWRQHFSFSSLKTSIPASLSHTHWQRSVKLHLKRWSCETRSFLHQLYHMAYLCLDALGMFLPSYNPLASPGISSLIQATPIHLSSTTAPRLQLSCALWQLVLLVLILVLLLFSLSTQRPECSK